MTGEVAVPQTRCQLRPTIPAHLRHVSAPHQRIPPLSILVPEET